MVFDSSSQPSTGWFMTLENDATGNVLISYSCPKAARQRQPTRAIQVNPDFTVNRQSSSAAVQLRWRREKSIEGNDEVDCEVRHHVIVRLASPCGGHRPRIHVDIFGSRPGERRGEWLRKLHVCGKGLRRPHVSGRCRRSRAAGIGVAARGVCVARYLRHCQPDSLRAARLS